MSAKQNNPVTPPNSGDKNLTDFAGSIQRNLVDLFQDSHIHMVKSTLPTTVDGTGKPQDIALVDDGTNVYIVVRTSRGWFRTSALTAL